MSHIRNAAVINYCFRVVADAWSAINMTILRNNHNLRNYHYFGIQVWQLDYYVQNFSSIIQSLQILKRLFDDERQGKCVLTLSDLDIYRYEIKGRILILSYKLCTHGSPRVPPPGKFTEVVRRVFL